MPSVGHIAVGMAAARLEPRDRRVPPAVLMVGLVLLSCLPDADVVAFRFGIPYAAPFGHRGAAHSLIVALACGMAVAAAARLRGWPAARFGVSAGVVVASHGLLDTLTDGGLGIALLWPFSNARYFAPWRPIPVAPLGHRLLTSHGLHLMGHEVLLFLPLFILGVWPRRS